MYQFSHHHRGGEYEPGSQRIEQQSEVCRDDLNLNGRSRINDDLFLDRAERLYFIVAESVDHQCDDRGRWRLYLVSD